MSLEDIAAMQTTKPEARTAYNKFLINVYGSCMEYPVRGLIQTSCEKESKIQNPAVCNCVSNNMAVYAKGRGKTDLRRIIIQNPNIQDPATALTSSRAYQTAERDIALKCAKEGLKGL